MREEGRQRASERYKSVGILPEEAFQRITAMATDLLVVPFAFLSFAHMGHFCVNSRRKKSYVSDVRDEEFSRATMIRGTEVLVVPDMQKDPRFTSARRVFDMIEPRFYAAASLIMPDGHPFGVFGILDDRLRSDWNDVHATILSDLADITVDEMELRRLIAAREKLQTMYTTKPKRVPASRGRSTFRTWWKSLLAEGGTK
jgi:GAF domain-containing protein